METSNAQETNKMNQAVTEAPSNETFITYKNFYLNSQWKNFYKFEKDTNLSFQQKKLLKARELAKKNNTKEAMELIERGPYQSKYLEGDRLLLFGYLKFLYGEYNASIDANLRALDLFNEISLEKNKLEKYKCLFNASASALRINLKSFSLTLLEKARAYAEEETQKFELDRRMAVMLALKGEFYKSFELINQLKIKSSMLNPEDKYNFYLIASDCLVRGNRYKDALQMLDEVRFLKYTREKDWFLADHFFTYLLNYGIHSAQIVMVDYDAQEKCTEHQLKSILVKSLIKGEQSKAKQIWARLREVNKTLYREEFGEFYDQDETMSAFGQILNEILNNKSEKIENPFRKNSFTHRLLQKLIDSPSSLSKKELIEYTWEVPYDSIYDSRFYKLLEREKKEIEPKIIYRNGAYLLQK